MVSISASITANESSTSLAVSVTLVVAGGLALSAVSSAWSSSLAALIRWNNDPIRAKNGPAVAGAAGCHVRKIPPDLDWTRLNQPVLGLGLDIIIGKAAPVKLDGDCLALARLKFNLGKALQFLGSA